MQCGPVTVPKPSSRLECMFILMSPTARVIYSEGPPKNIRLLPLLSKLRDDPDDPYGGGSADCFYEGPNDHDIAERRERREVVRRVDARPKTSVSQCAPRPPVKAKIQSAHPFS